MAKGGTRIGGKPKGYKAPKTLEKEAAREAVRKQVIAEMTPMTAAQIAAAKGIQHFVLRDKNGRFEKVTSEVAALAALNDPEAVYEFWTRDPSIQAYTDLMNRAIDKPSEHVDIDLNVTDVSEASSAALKAELRALFDRLESPAK